MNDAIHGGDVLAAAARLGRAPETLLDLSANINAAGPPPRVRERLRALGDDPGILERYPDRRLHVLRDALVAREHVDPHRIAIGNGTAALLDAIVIALRPPVALVPVPAFSEYARTLRAHGIPIRTILPDADLRVDLRALADAATAHPGALAILANPTNPAGTMRTRAELEAAFDALPPGLHVVVDEAFIDYVPDERLAAPESEARILLRSLTKFYAIPGVRAGYALAAPPLVRRIEAALPSWPVGILDAELAAAAFGDPAYETSTRRETAARRRSLAAELRARGCRPVAGHANFLLVDVGAVARGETASGFADALARRAGILVRACDDYAGLPPGVWVRVAVRDEAANRRFLDALER